MKTENEDKINSYKKDLDKCIVKEMERYVKEEYSSQGRQYPIYNCMNLYDEYLD